MAEDRSRLGDMSMFARLRFVLFEDNGLELLLLPNFSAHDALNVGIAYEGVG